MTPIVWMLLLVMTLVIDEQVVTDSDVSSDILLRQTVGVVMKREAAPANTTTMWRGIFYLPHLENKLARTQMGNARLLPPFTSPSCNRYNGSTLTRCREIALTINTLNRLRDRTERNCD